ncbi:MAG: homoserine O-succinyltransferase [Lachnospiraceae bacterium]|nr:homoserine O-succinyltransferase [Lachnospiraceae bacterium]MBR0148401.1 homoserine O-succinyltransferase [Lachnospiraceae bacterium]MBR4174440.1 homoserine O-succinyltransferase [Lachnospiraceae bacterium]
MPIKTQRDLPARSILENENIFVMDEYRSAHQDIRPLKIAILNLMPLKEDTELQLLRALSNTPLQIDVTFLTVKSHVSKNTPASHLNRFYMTYYDIRENKFDGLIITGAPVELMDFEEVDYWDELCEIMDWSKRNVTSTFHICWGAQAGLYHHFGIKKIVLPQKLSGIYSHRVMNRKIPLVRGFDDIFLAPHSRNTATDDAAIDADDRLTVLARSEEAGIYLCMADEGRQIFVLGHSEYDRYTLRQEYERDLKKGINPIIPVNYFPDDDPTKKPYLQWRSHSNNLYSNWLNYYVYQITPYDLGEIDYGMWI